MSSMEGLDIRAPIGGLFTLLGVMLVGYGLVAGSPNAASGVQETNVNVWWGAVMVVFGVLMLVLARRAMGKQV